MMYFFFLSFPCTTSFSLQGFLVAYTGFQNLPGGGQRAAPEPPFERIPGNLF
jgi:hypothetical protein